MKLKLTQFRRRPEIVMAAKITEDMINDDGDFVFEYEGKKNVYTNMRGGAGCWVVVDNGFVSLLTDKSFMFLFAG